MTVASTWLRSWQLFIPDNSLALYALRDPFKDADGAPMKDSRSVGKLVFKLKDRE